MKARLARKLVKTHCPNQGRLKRALQVCSKKRTKDMKYDVLEYENENTYWSGRRIREELIRQDGDRCCWCGCKVTLGGNGTSDSLRLATIEHLTPRRHGGKLGYRLSNAALACKTCNTQRTPPGGAK